MNKTSLILISIAGLLFTAQASAAGTSPLPAAAVAVVSKKAVGAILSTKLGGMNLVAVPEPSTYGLAGVGALAGVALVRRRRRTR